jgi:hypothetical protein
MYKVIAKEKLAPTIKKLKIEAPLNRVILLS